MKNKEKVSVIITAYNVEEYVSKAVQSVKDQTYPEIEIIVVEDCSTDNTLEVLKSIEGIKLVRHSVNAGAGKARKTGIENSTGDFILLLDADDWLEPNCIEELIKTQKKFDSDLTGCNIRTVYKDSIKEENTEECCLEGVDKFKKIAGKTPFLNPILVRRTLYDKVPYCPRRFIEDSPTLWKLLFYANRLVYNGKVGYNYYQRDGSLCHVSSPYKRDLFTVLAIIDVLIFLQRNHGEDIIEETGLVKELSIYYNCMKLNQPLSIDKDDYQEERGFIDKFVRLFNN